MTGLGARLSCVDASRLYCRNKVCKVGRKIGTEGRVGPLNTRNGRGRLQSLFQHEVGYSGHSTRSSVTARPFTGTQTKSLSSQGPTNFPKGLFSIPGGLPCYEMLPITLIVCASSSPSTSSTCVHNFDRNRDIRHHAATMGRRDMFSYSQDSTALASTECMPFIDELNSCTADASLGAIGARPTNTWQCDPLVPPRPNCHACEQASTLCILCSKIHR